jgi:hypothetical protein
MKNLLTITCLPLALLAALPLAQGQTSASPEIEEILQRSDQVLSAQVVDILPRWEGGLILSRITLRQIDCIHGECRDELMYYEVLGGQLDGVVQVIAEMPVPAIGVEVVVMVEEHSSSSPGEDTIWLYFPENESRTDNGNKSVVLMRRIPTEVLRRFVEAVNR